MSTINVNLLKAKFDAKVQEVKSLATALSKENTSAVANCDLLNEHFLEAKPSRVQINNHLMGLKNTINESLSECTDQGNALYEKLCEAQCLAMQIYFNLGF